MKNRLLRQKLLYKSSKKTGRIIIVTGARQTGKTTLVKSFPDMYEYISMEDPVLRDEWQSLTAGEWHHRFPMAILDEVQKVPLVIESIKAVYDEYNDARYILLGSSQILLLQKVRESLAGRASIYELFPLTLPELRTTDWNDKITPSYFFKLLSGSLSFDDLKNIKPLLDKDFAQKQVLWDFYLKWGLMPTLVDEELDDEERIDWLKNYAITYLQRDIRDIARMNDLEPFIKLQKQCALYTSQTINFSSLASASGIAVNTAKKFISYLEISYQAFSLRPWSKNENKRMVKSPKLHMLDPGIIRTLTGHYSKLNGHEFESAVVSESYKQIKSFGVSAEMFHLRTTDGREVDLLIELPSGYFAFEIKMSNHIRKNDARHFKELESILDKPLLGCVLLSNDRTATVIDDNIIAVPVGWFLG